MWRPSWLVAVRVCGFVAALLDGGRVYKSRTWLVGKKRRELHKRKPIVHKALARGRGTPTTDEREKAQDPRTAK